MSSFLQKNTCDSGQARNETIESQRTPQADFHSVEFSERTYFKANLRSAGFSEQKVAHPYLSIHFQSDIFS